MVILDLVVDRWRPHSEKATGWASALSLHLLDNFEWILKDVIVIHHVKDRHALNLHERWSGGPLLHAAALHHHSLLRLHLLLHHLTNKAADAAT